MGIALSLVAAVGYGGGNFIGGATTRAANFLTVTFFGQLASAVLVVVTVPVLARGDSRVADVAWGAAAGVSGAVGVALLYRGLAVGAMSTVAPVVAVLASLVPVPFGVASGDDLSSAAAAGIAVAIAAIALSSRPRADDRTRVGRSLPGFPEAIGAGLALGGFLVLFARAGSGALAWPLVASRATSLSLLAVAMAVTGAPFRAGARTLRATAAIGALDFVANVSFVVATRHAALAVVGVLTSMHPAVTVVLAATLLRERPSRAQVTGLVLAAASIALLATG